MSLSTIRLYLKSSIPLCKWNTIGESTVTLNVHYFLRFYYLQLYCWKNSLIVKSSTFYILLPGANWSTSYEDCEGLLSLEQFLLRFCGFFSFRTIKKNHLKKFKLGCLQSGTRLFNFEKVSVSYATIEFEIAFWLELLISFLYSFDENLI